MRFSDQYQRYRAQFGNEPAYPRRPVVCYWFRRKGGTIGERIDVELSPAACRHFRIWTPQPINQERAERIAAWMGQQEGR